MTMMMQKIMLSCQKATELIEKDSLTGLNLLEKSQLFLHTRMCEACKTYQTQSIFLDKALQKLLSESEENGSKPSDNETAVLIKKIEKIAEP